MGGKIKVTVWNEFHDERKHPVITELYPGGIHAYIASFLKYEADMEVCAHHFYENEDFGLSDDVLNHTDVLIVYSHSLQDKVPNERVRKVISRVVSEGMGIIFLHSALWMNLAQMLIGPGGYCGYREIEERERIWVVNRNHPIAQGLPSYFDFPHSEMYGEPADFPDPDELIFLSWYQGGEAARSGMTWRRGAGRVFYFSPGHAWYNVMQMDTYHLIIKNAIRWAVPPVQPPKQDRGANVPAIEDIQPGGGLVRKAHRYKGDFRV